MEIQCLTLLSQAKNPISPAAAAVSKAQFWRHNTFIVLAIGCNLINFLYYLPDHMIKSAVIEIAGIVILFGFMMLNLRGPGY